MKDMVEGFALHDGLYRSVVDALCCAAHEPEGAWNSPARAEAHARAWSNGRMLCIFSCPAGADPWLFGRTRMLHPGMAASDSQLGAAIRIALEHSCLHARELQRLPLPMLTRRERRIRFLRWLLALMERYRCRTMRSFLTRMRRCDIVMHDGLLVLMPTRHCRLDGWICLSQESALILPTDGSNAELGAALRLGLERCINDHGGKRGKPA
jgi:hypothetical protein